MPGKENRFMKIDITADCHEDSGITPLVNELLDILAAYFKKKTYSEKEPEIFIVLVCEPKELKLRRRYNKKENVLYYDIILDYYLLKKERLERKKEIIANNIIDSLDWLNKYDFGIDLGKIKNDMNKLFVKRGWIKK
jgi:hypothetical protein